MSNRATTQTSSLRRWAIPLASTLPIAAIVFAFSLGPSPRKIVDDYLRSDAPAAERQARLEATGRAGVHALTERIGERGLPHRDEAFVFLAQSRDPRALFALERVTGSAKETPEIRKMAFEAMLAIDRRHGLAVAEELAGRPDVLGAAARRALETQERTELTR